MENAPNCDSQNFGFRDFQPPVPSLWMCYTVWQKDFADVIKVTTQGL